MGWFGKNKFCKEDVTECLPTGGCSGSKISLQALPPLVDSSLSPRSQLLSVTNIL